MSSAVTRTEPLYISPIHSQTQAVSNVSTILESVLSKQTSYGAGGTYFWNKKRFKLYSNRIEYSAVTSNNSHSTIYLKTIQNVIHDHSATNNNQFIITFKSNQQMFIKADTEDDKEMWIKRINKLLMNVNRYSHDSHDSDEHILSWKFQKSEKQNYDDVDLSMKCCLSPNKNPKKTKHIISQSDAEYGTAKNNKLLFLKRYYPLRQIAFGPFGHIVLANDTFKNRNVIVQLADNKHIHHTVKESIAIMKDLKCKHSFQLIENGQNAILTYAIYSCDILMRLSNFIALLPNKRMEESLAVIFALQVLDLIKCLHKHHIVLNQMSSEELYITEGGSIYLMSFAPFVDAGVYIGNSNYVPPEYFTEGINDKISDLFRFGVFLYEILVGVPPFWDVNEESIVTRIQNILYDFPKFLSKNAKDIISKLLLEQRNRRLGFKHIHHIERHNFFKISPNTESIQRIINTFSFSSAVIWPSSIVVRDESNVSKIIAQNKNKMNFRTTYASKLKMKSRFDINESSTNRGNINSMYQSNPSTISGEKYDMTNDIESSETSEL